MTNDEMERMQRNMQFIVEQQAQFAADIGKIRDVQAQFAADMQQVREVLHTHSEAMVSLMAAVGKIADAHTTLANRTSDLEAKLGAMADAHKETDQRLSAFITYVEKYISSHNGGERSRH